MKTGHAIAAVVLGGLGYFLWSRRGSAAESGAERDNDSLLDVDVPATPPPATPSLSNAGAVRPKPRPARAVSGDVLAAGLRGGVLGAGGGIGGKR